MISRSWAIACNPSAWWRIPGRRQLLSEGMRRRAPTSVLVALLAVLALLSCPAASTASSLPFGPCAKGTVFSCTTLAVPLDRTERLPGTISLSVERRLAGSAPSRDAVVALAGGPGPGGRPRREPRGGGRPRCPNSSHRRSHQP